MDRKTLKRSDIALAVLTAVGLALIVAGVWLAWSMPAGLVASGVAVLCIAALLFVEV